MQHIPEEVINSFHEGLCIIKLSEGKLDSVWSKQQNTKF